MKNQILRKQPAKRSGGILDGALWLTFSALVVKLLGFLYKIPLSHLLRDEGMGYFNSAYTVYSFFFILCSAGIPKAVSILTTEAVSRGDAAFEGRVYRVALLSFGSFSLLISMLLALFSSQFAALVGIRDANTTLIAIAPSILFVTLGGVVRGVLTGRGEMSPVAFSQILEASVKLILGVLLALLGKKLALSLPLISTLTVLGVTLGSLLSFLYLLKCLKWNAKENKKTESSDSKKPILSKILKISAPITVSAALGSISGIIDLTLITKQLMAKGMSEESAGALYGNYSTIALPMLGFVSAIISAITLAVFPHLTHAYVKKNEESFRELLSLMYRIVAFVSVPITFAFIFLSEEFLSLLFPSESIAVGVSCLRTIAPAVIFLSFLTAANTALEASGMVTAPMLTLGIGMLVKAPVSYFLIGSDRFGLLGAPIGTVISYATAFLLSICLLCVRRNFKGTFTWELFYPLLAIGAAIPLAKIIENVFRLHSMTFLSRVVPILIAMLIYFFLAYFVGNFGKNTLRKLSKYTNQVLTN